MLTKEEVQNLMAKEGQVRGVVFDTDRQYILKRWGKEGLEKVEKLSQEYGFPIRYSEFKPFEWYPAPLRALSYLLIKEAFNLPEEELREMGRVAPKFSLIVRLFFKLFGSIEKLAEEAPSFWRKHWTVGELKAVYVDSEKKEMVLRLEGFNFHPLYCVYLEGYFETVVRITRPRGSVVVVKETASSHEFSFKWTI
jgi:hypothetical protein